MTTQKKTTQKKTTHKNPQYKRNRISKADIEASRKLLEENDDFREAYDSLEDLLLLNTALGIIMNNPFATREALESTGRLMGIQIVDTQRKFKKYFQTDTPVTSVE